MRFSKILILPMLFLLALLQNVWATDSDADDGDIDDVPTVISKARGTRPSAVIAVDHEEDEVTILTLDSISGGTANLLDSHGNLFFVDLMGESVQDAFQQMAGLLGQLNSDIVDLDGTSGKGAKNLKKSIERQLCGIQESKNENPYLQYLFQGWGGFFSAAEESTSSPSKARKSKGKSLEVDIGALRGAIGGVYSQIISHTLTKEALAAKIPSPRKDKTIRSRRKALADLGNVGGSPRKGRKGKYSTATAVAAPPPVSETTTA